MTFPPLPTYFVRLLVVLAVGVPIRLEAQEAAARAEPKLESNSKVIIIETTPDVERSDMIRQVVEALEKNGTAKRDDLNLRKMPPQLEAILRLNHDTRHENVLKLVETLKSLGVQRMAFRVSRDQDESMVIIQCPANVTWRKVHEMTKALKSIEVSNIDIRVATNNNPVTATNAFNADAAAHLVNDEQSAPKSQPSINLNQLTQIFRLKHIQAKDAVRMIEQLYTTANPRIGTDAMRLTVDERTNSVIVYDKRENLEQRSKANQSDPPDGVVLRAVADERTNSVIVLSTREMMDQIEALVQELDVETPQRGGGVNVFDNLIGKGNDPHAAAQSYMQMIEDSYRDQAEKKVVFFDFGIVRDARSADELRKQYESFEQKSRELATRVRGPLPDPRTGERLQKELRGTVEQAFTARQNLQRAELADFARRLQRIQRSIESREKISRQIIDRRVEELLKPDLEWNDRSLGKSTPKPNHSISGRQQSSPIGLPGPAHLPSANRLRSEVAPPANAGPGVNIPPVGPAAKVDKPNSGAVIKREDNGEVIISMGATSGVRVGDRFHVTNGTETLGELEVVAPGSKQATTRIVAEASDLPIRRGDRAMPLPRVSVGKAIQIHATVFDLDDDVEGFDRNSIQIDAKPAFQPQLEALLRAGQATMISRPKVITHLGRQSEIFIGNEIPLQTSGIKSSRFVGERLAITPLEEGGKPILQLEFESSRVAEFFETTYSTTIPVIQSNSVRITVNMQQYGGHGKLIGPIRSVANKHRYLHLIIEPLQDDSKIQADSTEANISAISALENVQIALDKTHIGKLAAESPDSIQQPSEQRDRFRFNAALGSKTMLLAKEIKGQESAELKLTLSVPTLDDIVHRPASKQPRVVLAYNAIPVEVTSEDINQSLSGQNVTKVIFLRDDGAVAKFDTVVSTKLDPGSDPLQVAKASGVPVLIMQISTPTPTSAP